ncbi:hypothetical protein HPB52_021441 [Rhipicephalus sanguineus]|uniref:Small ribosomal subunit protein eS25 n=1 Tax=Rhipicephalus sanguineus TaxID=34632 RepID=A0A9D4PSF5_RHISA|nr:hypothetical protein HPB52_021441 [Rhipicephalus sanguineus]
MPPKQDSKKKTDTKGTAKKKEGSSGGKAKKKKWSKGKVRDKLNNLVLFDKATYDKLLKEVPSYKLITPSVVSERLKVRGSLARKALEELLQKGEFTFGTDDGFFGRCRYVESVLAVIVSAEEAAQQVCRIQRLCAHQNIGFANSRLSSTRSSLSSFTTPVTTCASALTYVQKVSQSGTTLVSRRASHDAWSW